MFFKLCKLGYFCSSINERVEILVSIWSINHTVYRLGSENGNIFVCAEEEREYNNIQEREYFLKRLKTTKTISLEMKPLIYLLNLVIHLLNYFILFCLYLTLNQALQTLGYKQFLCWQNRTKVWKWDSNKNHCAVTRVNVECLAPRVRELNMSLTIGITFFPVNNTWIIDCRTLRLTSCPLTQYRTLCNNNATNILPIFFKKTYFSIFIYLI